MCWFSGMASYPTPLASYLSLLLTLVYNILTPLISKQMRIPDVNHPVRIVLFWKERADAEASKALVSNRLLWEVIRMVLVYRHRWTGTETFHRDGKQEEDVSEVLVCYVLRVYESPST